MSRPQSQAPSSRKRSNTVQSVFSPTTTSAPPLKIGDWRTLTTWVNEPTTSSVKFNHRHWPGVAEGDLLCISTPLPEHAPGFLFVVPPDDPSLKYQLQISLPRPVLEKFGLRSNSEVTVTKVDQERISAEFVEFVFQDQYLGRNDMWRLGRALVGRCLYVDEQVSFIGVIAATVQALYINGEKVSAAYVSPATKVVYRSLSAKITIFIQICRELWEFAGDGERYNEKIVHSFLPALFDKWKAMNTNHIVTIVLISRVFYDASETGYAAGPLRKDEDGRSYKDFFKVITDLEVLYDWRPTLVSLKDSFWAFQRDILLAHHYHRNLSSSTSTDADPVRLVGQISYAHDGPLLEALNLALKPTETHYIDRSLSLTGASTIVITPGTGYFRVSKQLLRLTTTRMLDQGFALDMISLAKPPLHQTPIFCFKGAEPHARLEAGKIDSRTFDPLWGGDDGADLSGRELKTFWWEPFWMQISFWDRQMDLPFRKDRFVARARMHEIEMLGLLDHDVLSSIEIPYLEPEHINPITYETMTDTTDSDLSQSDTLGADSTLITPEEADQFDMNVFNVRLDTSNVPTARNSISSNSSGAVTSTTSRDLKRSSTIRTSETSRISPIQESPRPEGRDLQEDSGALDREQRLSVVLTGGALSTSPSQASILSARSSRSQRSTRTTAGPHRQEGSREETVPRNSGISRLAPTWLLNPFRSGPSQPQTSPVFAAGSSGTPSPKPAPPTQSKLASTRPSQLQSQQQQPVTIRGSNTRPTRQRTIDDDLVPHRGSLTRHSPVGTPPRDSLLSKRRDTLSSVANLPIVPPNLALYVHPTKPLTSVPYAQAALARRWQHIFAHPLTKQDIKWRSMTTPACLPLSVEHFPSTHELETSYDVFSYDFVYDPSEMHSFLVQLPPMQGSPEETRRAWALAMMRGMVALRLAQGFQFILRPSRSSGAAPDAAPPTSSMRRTKTYVGDDGAQARPIGAAQVLTSAHDAVYLSMSNEIHHIVYTGDSIQVRRYVRRMPRTELFEYQCLIWPKLGGGYTEMSTAFSSHGMERYGWNRLDMLVAGYEHRFHESLRYWRTRFVVIPTDESPHTSVAPSGEKLNEEETRLLGMDKLAELFAKARRDIPGQPQPPVRFITTDLGPAQCVLDDGVIAQVDEIHATGPLRKKMKSERDLAELSLQAVAKAMRDEDGVPIKENKWHRRRYANSFTGAQLVSWLVREFRDVSTREQGAEWGAKLMEQGLFDHCRGTHGFLDGHYFYVLRGEYIVPVTPKASWFSRPTKHEEMPSRGGHSPMTPYPGKKARKRHGAIVLTQFMVIDVDPKKQSDQAESVILHYDIIHNPATCFHFEMHWIGTTARYIDDLLKQWGRTIERYGLKLVEAYVEQISDIREKNAFQSYFPIALAVAPPSLSETGRRLPEGVQALHYFESALLRKAQFVLDIEGEEHYTDQAEVDYSYRRSHFKHSQWVHRSGVAFVQVVGGTHGFRFLTNRLMAPGRIGTALKYQRPAAMAEEIRIKLHEFCSDERKLGQFYEDEIALLEQAPEEPPPLRI
ncbi:uncharacterized protein BXZ73DRAFT_48994 [Epithele typhae]|uniref:uncharacterized protein n=1 Tax=Epithele typhae TaxID=378194 RepID=UPI0020071F95|nr:uncharacterized protein BXZ73DRAFT_48994 [Epithele typhae]KAH9927160.1 hypothetical protein BXZ73DRAFT_48994 [Epithele typhae]